MQKQRPRESSKFEKNRINQFSLRNEHMDFSKMTIRWVAVITDMVQDGKPEGFFNKGG